MNPYIAFTLAALVTYALRSSMTFADGRLACSKRLTTLTAVVSPAVLAAMVSNALATHGGRFAAPGAAETLAVVAAFAAARRIGNVGGSLAVGLVVFWAGRLAGLA